jgi:OOP family OmpA-OmpF porin
MGETVFGGCAGISGLLLARLPDRFERCGKAPWPISFLEITEIFRMPPAHDIIKPLLLLLALSFFVPTAALAQTRDVAGSRDFPGIGRFAGSVISGHQVKNFDTARMQAAPFRDGKPSDTPRLEGRITRIAYRSGPGPSIVEVSRNFETQLTKAGFEPLLNCETEACGGIPFTEAIEALPIPQMWVDGFNYHYYAARKSEGGRET